MTSHVLQDSTVGMPRGVVASQCRARRGGGGADMSVTIGPTPIKVGGWSGLTFDGRDWNTGCSRPSATVYGSSQKKELSK